MMLLRPQISRLRPLAVSRFICNPRVSPCGIARWGLRNSSTTPPKAVVKPSGKKFLFPERLIIYHAGTTRTVFLGCLKVTTIFIFVFFSVVVAPTHFYAIDQPLWIAPAVLLSGIIPLVSVAFITSPFVNYVHLRLPTFARNSRELLIRYSKTLPKDAEIDITTMNFIGKPRVTRMKAADLYPAKKRFGLINYVRDATEDNKKRPWWMMRAVAKFGVHGGRTRIMRGEIWENVRKGIEKKNKKTN